MALIKKTRMVVPLGSSQPTQKEEYFEEVSESEAANLVGSPKIVNGGELVEDSHAESDGASLDEGSRAEGADGGEEGRLRLWDNAQDWVDSKPSESSSGNDDEEEVI